MQNYFRGGLIKDQMDFPIHKIAVPTPFQVGDVNAYLWDEEPLTLIDSGPPTKKAKSSLVSSLSLLGYDIRDVERVVLTHLHPDHSGLASFIKEESGASIAVHEDDIALFKNLKSRPILDMCVLIGLDKSVADLVAQYYSEMPAPNFSVDVDIRLHDGDHLRSSSGTDFEVIHCPCHSPGSISLYNPHFKCLISGDTLLKEITPNALFSWEIRDNPGLKLYKSTLNRLLGYDVDLVLPGHGGGLKGKEIKDRIREILKYHEERGRKILGTIKGNGKMTIYQISIELFGSLPISEVPLSIFEVTGHLKILKERGLVESREESGILFYSAL